MSHRNCHFSIIMVFLMIFSSSLTTVAQQFRISRGERPPIDLKKVSDEAFEKAVLKIKIRSEYAGLLDQLPPRVNESGNVQFGISSVDQLNNHFQVVGLNKVFESPAFSKGFTDRHRAWDFHMWYYLYADKNADIKAMVNAYNQLDEVETAEPVYKKRLIGNVPEKDQRRPENFNPADPSAFWTPDDPLYYEQWHYHNTGQQNGIPDSDIDLPEAWEIEKGNSDLIVAIVDEGVQFTHPDIEGNMWEGIGFNFVANNATVVPGSHGTHVGGTIAAVNNNGEGVSGIAGGSGTANGVRLMSAQVFTSTSSGGFALAPVWAADNGAAISQNSWGYTTAGVYEQDVLDAIDYFNANGGGDALTGGGITIFAAGNDGTDGEWYPGYYSGTFAVAATNNKDIKSYYSNYGTWVDISAPGGETNSVFQRGVLSTVTDGAYAFYQGTSMACPHVSGVAALVASLAYGEIGPIDLAEILQNTTDNHYDVNPGYLGKLGAGRVNAYNALSEAQSFLTGVRNPINFSVTVPGPYQIDLGWTPNNDGDEVMLAWSFDGSFGTPAEGNSYNVGDPVPGGGIVLYKGLTQSFSHIGLSPATTYYYRAWSVNSSLQYSTGRSATASTTCEPFALPFQEDFEASAIDCWEQEVIQGGNSWAFGSGNGASNPPDAFDGITNIYHKIENLVSSGITTRVITPQLLLSGLSNTELRFWYTNARRTYIVWNFQDVLNVYYKNALQADWTLLQTFNTNITDWTEVVIPLPNPSDEYYIAFEAIAYFGHGVCLDQINVTGNSGGLTYTIMATASDNGAIAPSGEVLVSQGNDQTFVVTANTGYHINNLISDGIAVEAASGTQTYSHTFENVDQNHSISADFALNVYSIQTDVSPANSGTISGGGDFAYGETVSLTANAANNYEFSAWSINGNQVSSENPYTFTVSANVMVMAIFEISQTLTVTVTILPEGAGTVTGAGNFSFLESATLTAIPNDNNTFFNWKENGITISTLNPFTFFVATNRNLTAVFGPPPFITEAYNTQVRVYPNPALDRIVFELAEAAEVTISNATGQIIYQETLEAGSQNVNLANVEKGVYFIHVQGKELTGIGRFVIMK